jgi:hypothetical protein
MAAKTAQQWNPTPSDFKGDPTMKFFRDVEKEVKQQRFLSKFIGKDAASAVLNLKRQIDNLCKLPIKE